MSIGAVERGNAQVVKIGLFVVGQHVQNALLAQLQKSVAGFGFKVFLLEHLVAPAAHYVGIFVVKLRQIFGAKKRRFLFGNVGSRHQKRVKSEFFADGPKAFGFKIIERLKNNWHFSFARYHQKLQLVFGKNPPHHFGLNIHFVVRIGVGLALNTRAAGAFALQNALAVVVGEAHAWVVERVGGADGSRKSRQWRGNERVAPLEAAATGPKSHFVVLEHRNNGGFFAQRRARCFQTHQR